jgi:hypothetical protein
MVGPYVRFNLFQIIGLIALSVATILFVTLDDAGSMEATLFAVNVKPNPETPAAGSASATALAAITIAANAAAEPNEGDLTTLLEAYLNARKKEYVLSTSPASWFDSNSKEVHLPSNPIPYRFTEINEGMSACADGLNAGLFAFGQGFGPSSANYGTDAAGVCADQPPSAKNGLGDDGKKADDCKDTFLSKLFSSNDGPLGITEKTDSDWNSDACKFHRRAYGGVIAAAILAILFFGGLVYLIETTDYGSEDEDGKRRLRAQYAVLSLLFWASALALMIVFSQSHVALHTDRGIKEQTIVPLTDKTEIKDFPARATMYDELFKRCFPDVPIEAASDLTNGRNGGNPVPNLGAGARCAAPEVFQESISKMGLYSAANCKYGAQMTGFYKTKGVCEYPENFATVTEHNGPYLRYEDKRTGLDKKGQAGSFEVFTTDYDGREWLIGLAVLWGVFFGKQTFVTIGFVTGLDLFTFFGCVDKKSPFTVAGGYASAL